MELQHLIFFRIGRKSGCSGECTTLGVVGHTSFTGLFGSTGKIIAAEVESFGFFFRRSSSAVDRDVVSVVAPVKPNARSRFAVQ